MWESGGGWLLPLDGMRVVAVAEESGALDLTLEDSEGGAATVSGLMPLQAKERLLGRRVARASVTKGSRIEVVFDDDLVLARDAQIGVEAWEVVGPGRVFVVSAAGPDDEPAIWP